jgi:hypothetical protein
VDPDLNVGFARESKGVSSRTFNIDRVVAVPGLPATGVNAPNVGDYFAIVHNVN